MLVKEVMTGKVRTIAPSASYSEILKLLIDHHISGLPVVNKKGKVIGVVSEKDLFNKLFPSQKVFYKDPEYYMNFDRIERDAKAVKKVKASHIMSREIISIGSDEHVLKACSLFIKHKVRRLPVIDNGKLVGIISTNNIYKHYLARVVGV